MIRELVEKLRGIVFTPEELQGVIEPAVNASEEQKYYRNPFKRKKLIESFINECSYNKQQSLKKYKLQEAMLQLAGENPDKLISIWNKIIKRRMLIEPFINECSYNKQQSLKKYKLQEALLQLAEENPDKLISIWDKIIKTRQLSVPEDCDNPDIIAGLDVETRLRVYDTVYVVIRYEDQKFTFVPLKERWGMSL